MVDILVADDNEKVHISIRMLLENDRFRRYNIHKVYNGQQAVIASQQKRFDICIMDVNMPVKNGIEAAREIHTLKPYGYMPILAVTGEDRSVIPNNIFDDILEKPFSNNELLKKIDEWQISILIIEPDFLRLSKELPMDEMELKELLDLRKQDLGYLRLRGTGDKFVVHKNVQNKISYDFAQGKQLSEFVDRSNKHPGNVHLYKNNFLANHWDLTPDELKVQSVAEDKLLSEAKYQAKTEKCEVKD